MSISAVSSSDPTSAASSSAATSSAGNEQRFLKLLVTQLNNQDPLNPMDNAQLTSQLAQMSTVTGIEKMNATLEALVGQSSSSQLLQAASMVGHAVLSPGTQIVGGNGPATFALELPSSAESVKAVITDASGKTVRSFDLGPLSQGLHSFGWTGDNDAGEAVAPGVYQIQVDAANGSTPVPATTLVYDEVASVTQAGAAGLSLDLTSGRSISLTDVRKLL
jgi:flagellar basal-body rod modification protein FlgD